MNEKCLEWTNDLIIGSINSMKLDHNGKKETTGDMKGWTKLEQSKIIKGHEVFFVVTGEKSNVIVVDFDNAKDYHNLTNSYYNREVLKREPIFDATLYPTIKTMKGFHVYFEYTNKLLQPDKTKLNVDIQGNKKRVYFEGTKYQVNSQEQFTYEWEVKETLKPIPETLLNYINELSKKKRTTKITSATYDANPNLEQLKSLLDIIDIQYINDRESWIKLVFAMKKMNIDEDYAKTWSLKTTTCELTDDDWDRTWNSADDDKTNGCTAGTIHYYAKLSNENQYLDICKNSEDIIYKKIIQTIIDKDKVSESQIAQLFEVLFPNHVVYVKSTDSIYVWSNDRWRKDDIKRGNLGRHLIAKKLEPYFTNKIKSIWASVNPLEGLSKENSLKISKISDIIVLIQTTSWMSNIWRELTCICIDKKHNIEFDINPNIIAFDNGKIDLHTGKFSKIVFNDFITISTGYDYVEPSLNECNKIIELFNQIFPNPEIRRSYWSILFNCLKGGQKDNFIIANGGGGNGKGVLNTLMLIMLGAYAYVAPVQLLTKDIKNGANPEVANLHLMRMVLMKEPNKKDKLLLGNIKQLTGNDSINARGLYSGVTKCLLCGTIILETNDRLHFDGKAGDAEIRRFVDILFESKFSDNEEELNDPTLSNVYKKVEEYTKKEFRESHRCALFKMILENADKNLYIPECVKERTLCYINDQDTFNQWVKETYVFTNDTTDIVSSKDMFTLYKESDVYLNTDKNERPLQNVFTNDYIKTDRNLKNKFKEKHYFMKGGKQVALRSVIVGIRKIEDVSYDDDDVEEYV
jgi:phage/plasmid-associated DNA primase